MFANEKGFEVSFLAPGQATASAVLAKFPVHAVLLRRSGVLVTVPSPQRFAVHALLVDMPGGPDDKKSLVATGTFIEALAAARHGYELGEAWEGGPEWRAALEVGKAKLAPGLR